MGKTRRNMGPTGLLLVNKPLGMTSHDVVSRIRRLAGTRQVGHTGTLDPEATGLLPLTLGFCTRLSNYLILETKCYEFTAVFGQATDTDDHTGKAIRTAPTAHITLQGLREALVPLVGHVMQRPPKYSALKVGGRRAHELARAGEAFELEPRPVVIEEVEVLGYEGGEARMRMRCGSGTYVRGLVRDVGEALGSAAHTSRIHRTQVGAFGLGQSVRLEDLREGEVEGHLLSARQMLQGLAEVSVDAKEARQIRLGQQVRGRGEPVEVGAAVVAVDEAGEFVALGFALADAEGTWQFAPKRVRPVAHDQ